MLLTNTQVSKLRKAFENNSSANIKLSKTQLHKIGKSGGFLGRLLGPLLKTGLLLMKNVLKPLVNSVLIPLRLTAAAAAAAAAAATSAAIYKKIFKSGVTTLIISNAEMNDIMNIVKSVKESGFLIKGVSETIKTEAKVQKGGFLSTFLGTLGASLLRNLLAGYRS